MSITSPDYSISVHYFRDRSVTPGHAQATFVLHRPRQLASNDTKLNVMELDRLGAEQASGDDDGEQCPWGRGVIPGADS